MLDTQKKLGDLFVHEIEVEEGTLQVGMALELKVDHEARSAIRANHSATHLLHEALRMVLGDHVAQKGSLVSPDRLRFDIAHPKPITPQEIAAVEDIANRVVLHNEPVVTRLMGVEEARESGARALFGEKYGDEVRVVSMGTIDGGANGPRPYSVELCGGTHVARTGDIGLVSIIGESAVAAGVRRIEAKTRDEARQRLNEDSRAFADLAALLRAPASEAAERLEALIEDKKKLERELADARRKLAMGGGGVRRRRRRARRRRREILRARGRRRRDEGSQIARRRGQAERRLRRRGDRRVQRGRQGEPRRRRDARSRPRRFNAVDLVRLGSAALGGKGGGGRPDMAQAGGPDGAKGRSAGGGGAGAQGEGGGLTAARLTRSRRPRRPAWRSARAAPSRARRPPAIHVEFEHGHARGREFAGHAQHFAPGAAADQVVGEIGDAGIVADEHDVSRRVGQRANDRLDRAARRLVEARLGARLDPARPGLENDRRRLRVRSALASGHEFGIRPIGNERADLRGVAPPALDEARSKSWCPVKGIALACRRSSRRRMEGS